MYFYLRVNRGEAFFICFLIYELEVAFKEVLLAYVDNVKTDIET